VQKTHLQCARPQVAPSLCLCYCSCWSCCIFCWCGSCLRSLKGTDPGIEFPELPPAGGLRPERSAQVDLLLPIKLRAHGPDVYILESMYILRCLKSSLLPEEPGMAFFGSHSFMQLLSKSLERGNQLLPRACPPGLGNGFQAALCHQFSSRNSLLSSMLSREQRHGQSSRGRCKVSLSMRERPLSPAHCRQLAQRVKPSEWNKLAETAVRSPNGMSALHVPTACVHCMSALHVCTACHDSGVPSRDMQCRRLPAFNQASRE